MGAIEEQKLRGETGVLKQSIEIAIPQTGITLRQFTPQDASDIFNLISNNRAFFAKYGRAGVVESQTAQAVLESKYYFPLDERILRFGIRNNGELIGIISLGLTKDDFQTHEKPKRGVLGGYIGEKFTRHGYMTTSVNALTKYAFDQGYETLYTHIDDLNKPSLRVMDRTGFTAFSHQDGKTWFRKTKPTS